jgi:hypothetical protein
MYRFQLIRTNDISGCSGTGIVADGVEWPDGRVTMRWRPGQAGISTTAGYDSMTDVLALHSHPDEQGRVRSYVLWLDERAPERLGAAPYSIPLHPVHAA